MARIRSIKPEFFCHEELYDLEEETGLPIRLAFAGLWTVCDREGRFKWRPRSIKAQVLPYDDVDFSRVLHALTTRGFVVKYASNGAEYGHVPGFARHQVVNNREAASVLPEPPETLEIAGLSRVVDACPTRAPRVPHACKGEGKGREGKGKEEEGGSSDVSQSRKPEPVFSDSPVFECVGNAKEWQPTQRQVAAWIEAYPGVEVVPELKKANAWLVANPKKRKTADGMPRFVHSWLSRATNATGPPRGGGYPSRDAAKAAATKSAFDTIRSLANGPDSGQSTGAGFLGVQPRGDT